MTDKKLPQNVLTILQDIGENSILFHLYLRIKETEWTVYKNLGDTGCDIILQRQTPSKKATDNNKIKIEVKTRQKFYTTSKRKNPDRQVQFFLSKNEYDSCDFLIGLWFDKNAYFIVPKTALKQAKTKYRFTVRKNKDGKFSGTAEQYRDNWTLITDKLK